MEPSEPLPVAPGVPALVFDTNGVLDVVLQRAPFAEAATRLFRAVAEGRIRGLLPAGSVTTIHYLASRTLGREVALADVVALLALFEIAPLDRAILAAAASAPGRDFEDAVVAETGRAAGATGVVTRDPKGFASGTLAVFTPADALALDVPRG